MTLLIMAICTVVWKVLYNFKIKSARHYQFFFQNFQKQQTLKYLKTTVEMTFTIKKANACSPWTASSVFNWKYLFWVNLVQKFKIISLSWNFVPRLIRICRILWWCSHFLFSTEMPFWANFVRKVKVVSLSWNFRLD